MGHIPRGTVRARRAVQEGGFLREIEELEMIPGEMFDAVPDSFRTRVFLPSEAKGVEVVRAGFFVLRLTSRDEPQLTDAESAAAVTAFVEGKNSHQFGPPPDGDDLQSTACVTGAVNSPPRPKPVEVERWCGVRTCCVERLPLRAEGVPVVFVTDDAGRHAHAECRWARVRLGDAP
jgi:hypothetical protein